MTLGLRFLVVLLATAITATSAWADVSISLDGTFAPGGLIIGKTADGNTVSMDGRVIRVSENGEFLLGLGRNVTGNTTIVVTSQDGETSSYAYDIAAREYDIQYIDGLPSEQVTPDPATLERIAAESALIRAARKSDLRDPLFLSGFDWPTMGRISGVFGSQRVLNGEPRNPHNGVDIAASTGTEVRAMADGRVTLVHEDMFYTGKSVVLDHGHGLTSIYVHMSKILTTVGELVRKGDVIGKVGQTGRATGPHLHWGVTLFSTHLDPALVTGPMPEQ